MRRRTFLAAAVACALSFAGCGFDILEDVATDPHPPRIFDLVVSPLTIRPDTGVSVRVGYADEGADVTAFRMRDRDSSGSWELVPAAPPVANPKDTPEPAPEYFPGTTGVAQTDPKKPIVMSLRQAGAHRIEIWAEDSHGSRSNKLEFVITVIL